MCIVFWLWIEEMSFGNGEKKIIFSGDLKRGTAKGSFQVKIRGMWCNVVLT